MILVILIIIMLLLLFLVILPLTCKWPFKINMTYVEEKLPINMTYVEENLPINMTNEEYQKLRIGQDIMIKMLKEFDSICAKYNIKYWAVSGTLLGTIRHNGFIPWDNDIDVGLMNVELKKLYKILEKELSVNYKLVLRDDPSKGKNRYWNGTYTKPDIYPEAKVFYSPPGPDSEIPFTTKNNMVISEKPCIDLFSFVEKNNMLIMSHFPMKYDFNEIFPLKRKNFDNIDIYVPNQYEKFISKEYSDYVTYPKFNDRKPEQELIYTKILQHNAQQSGNGDDIEIDIVITKDNKFILNHDFNIGSKIVKNYLRTDFPDKIELSDILQTNKNGIIFLDFKETTRGTDTNDVNSMIDKNNYILTENHKFYKEITQAFIELISLIKDVPNKDNILVASYIIPSKKILYILKKHKIKWVTQGYYKEEFKKKIYDAANSFYKPQYACYPSNILTRKIILKHKKYNIIHLPYGHLNDNIKDLIYIYMK